MLFSGIEFKNQKNAVHKKLASNADGHWVSSKYIPLYFADLFFFRHLLEKRSKMEKLTPKIR